MGILSPIQKQFIKRPDESKDQIVYKWPEMNIRKLTQLTVQPDEQVLFVKEGQVKGILTEGVHTLDGAGIPFIGGLFDVATRGDYFVSEIYFVSIKEFVNQLFGGPVDNVSDPVSNLAVGLKCFGEYSIKVTDPTKLVLNLSGTTKISSMEEIKNWVASQLLKVVREVSVEHIIAKDWEILGLASKNTELEKESVEKVNLLLSDYGLSITRLGNINLSIDRKDAETLKQLKRDTAYGSNMSAADAALKLGASKGFEKGGQNAGLFAAGLGIGMATSSSVVQSTMNNKTENGKFCSNCGKEIASDSKFCKFCGKQL